MNLDAAEKEIRAFFATGWADATEIAWPDVEFTVPNAETWVRFNCAENDGSQVSMGSPGNNRFRHFGIVTIQVFAPRNQAGADAREKAAAALAVFMGQQTTNGVTFQGCYARQVGNDENGYYQINVFAPFYYDELT